jgi:hypothetical protein
LEKNQLAREIDFLDLFTEDVNVPVLFNVNRLGVGLKGDVPLSVINNSVAVLNVKYQSTGFKFFLHGVTYWENRRWTEACEDYGTADTMRRMEGYQPAAILNVYTCEMNTLLGFAAFPNRPKYSLGVFVNYRSLIGMPNMYANYKKGLTLVHEVGHYFGLSHTFAGGCGGVDSPDTAPEAYPYTGSCDPTQPELVGRDTCLNDGQMDPITNFMDYSDDYCANEFTEGQVQRMQTLTNYYLKDIVYQNADLGPTFKDTREICRQKTCSRSKMPNGKKPKLGEKWCYIRGSDRRRWRLCD